MQNLVTEELNIDVDMGNPGLVRLLMTGKSTNREPGKLLIPFFAEALELAATMHAGIEVHFEELSHFNSSTIAAVIQVINTAQSRSMALALHYDPAQKWQVLSFEALQRAIRPFQALASTRVRFVETPTK